MKTFKIKKYDPYIRCHKGIKDDGKEDWIDVMANGDLPESTDPESLIGKTVEYDYDFPYISIAMRVRIQKTPPQP